MGQPTKLPLVSAENVRCMRNEHRERFRRRVKFVGEGTSHDDTKDSGESHETPDSMASVKSRRQAEERREEPTVERQVSRAVSSACTRCPTQDDGNPDPPADPVEISRSDQH